MKLRRDSAFEERVFAKRPMTSTTNRVRHVIAGKVKEELV